MTTTSKPPGVLFGTLVLLSMVTLATTTLLLLHNSGSYSASSVSEKACVTQRPPSAKEWTNSTSKSHHAMPQPRDNDEPEATSSLDPTLLAIAHKWDLPVEAPILETLREIRSHRPNYNRTTDLLALRHPLKTGGTSLSGMLDRMFEGRVVPGSESSDWWNRSAFERATKRHDPHNATASESFWEPLGVLYTHTVLRPVSGQKKNLLRDLRTVVPALARKRFRILTIVRNPLDRTASAYWAWRCKIYKHFRPEIRRTNGTCPLSELNLTEVMWKNIAEHRERCDRETGHTATPKCARLSKDPVGEWEHCSSVDALLRTGRHEHNFYYQELLGPVPVPPDVFVGSGHPTPTLEDVTRYTLRDLGGLVDYDPRHKEDIAWVAVTERFQESMCVFYYYFRFEPVPEQNKRVRPCRPLSIWEDRHRSYIEHNEPFDYAIWRAANAILDVRMDALRNDVRARLEAGESLEAIPYLAPGCYEEPDDD